MSTGIADYETSKRFRSRDASIRIAAKLFHSNKHYGIQFDEKKF